MLYCRVHNAFSLLDASTPHCLPSWAMLVEQDLTSRSLQRYMETSVVRGFLTQSSPPNSQTRQWCRKATSLGTLSVPFPGRNSQTKWFPAGKKSCGNLSLNDSGENTHKKTDVTGYTWETPFQCGTNMRYKMHVHPINVYKKDYTEELACDLAYYNTVTNGKKILIPLSLQ